MIDRLRALGGFARTRDVAPTSSDRRRLAAAIVAGAVVRVARGVVALPGAEDLAAALAHGGALTCVSALDVYGLPLLTPPAVAHVAVPADRGISRGVVQHWTTRPIGARVVALPLALAQARECLPTDEWVAAADAAVRRGLDLVDLRAHRPHRGRLAFDAAVRAIDGRSQSLPESLLRVALRDAGLVVEPQAFVRGIGHVDLLVEDVVVEVDGFAYHSGRREYREDRRRDRAAHRIGLSVLRYPFEEVVRGRDAVVGEIVAAVERARDRTAAGAAVRLSAPRGSGDSGEPCG